MNRASEMEWMHPVIHSCNTTSARGMARSLSRRTGRSLHPVWRLLVCGVGLIVGMGGSGLPVAAGMVQEGTPVRPAPFRPSFGSPSKASADSPPTAESAASDSSPGQGEPRRNEATQEANASSGTPVTSRQQPDRAPPGEAQRSTQLSDRVAPGGEAAGKWQAQRGTAAPTNQDTAPQEITKVSKTFTSLPNDGGQVWREYDILPYTSQITNHDTPQQAIVDWILKQTGTEMWFSQPLGILSATREKLIVYHTPEIHNEIHALVDRFLYTHGQKQTAIVNLVTVGNPNWRESVYQFLQPVSVNSPGVEAWLVSKENAALLYNQISQRSDFRNHSSGTVTLHNGQAFSLEKRSPVQFIRSIRWTPGQGSGYQPVLTQVNEGYSLSMSFLDSLDGQSVETVISCEVDQVEKLTGIRVPVPSANPVANPFSPGGSVNEKMNLQIPQIVSWRLQERIRWPANYVLLVSCGVVATPGADTSRPIIGLLDNRSTRADALLFIDFRGPENPRTSPSGPATANLRALPPK